MKTPMGSLWAAWVAAGAIGVSLLGGGFASTAFAATYTTSGNQILKDGVPVQLRGANGLHEYGVGSGDMNAWKMDVVRETIHNFQNIPLTGAAQNQAPTGQPEQYKHSLQNIVNDNRANGKVTIFCPFSWDARDTQDNLFLGKNPSSSPWWNDYKTKYRAIANQFKNQSDVWFDVWNEPYWWDANDPRGYTEALWLSDMKAMVDNIRSTGATNIILVPGSLMGQGETVVLNQGASLLSGRSNLVFGIHAYEKWLYDSQSQIESRMAAIQNKGFPIFFGEYGAQNNDTMDVANFLAACRSRKVGATAWIWKRLPKDASGVELFPTSERGALLRLDGVTPNDVNNYQYGTKVKGFCSEARSTELVKNGNFSSGLTSWAVFTASGTATVESGVLKLGSGSAGGGVSQSLSPKASTAHVLSAKGRVGVAGETLTVTVKGDGFTHNLSFNTTTLATKTLSFTTPSTATWFQVQIYKGTGSFGYADDISVSR